MNINVHESVIVTVSLTGHELDQLKMGNTLSINDLELDSFRNATSIIVKSVLQ